MNGSILPYLSNFAAGCGKIEIHRPSLHRVSNETIATSHPWLRVEGRLKCRWISRHDSSKFLLFFL